MGSDTKSRRWGGFVLASVAAAGLLVACNSHPAEFATSQVAIEVIEIHEGDVSPKLDILWMIDNSGSMCQEQKALRDNFGKFIYVLAEIDLDFHIGITTTHFITPEHKSGLGKREPVALPGHLQLTPQPLPGYDRSCYYKTNADGTANYDAPLEPIVDAILAAVECTKDPAKYAALKTPDMNKLRCTLDSKRWTPTLGCLKVDEVPIEDYFPDPDDYRVVGTEGRKFLRAEDYRNEDRTLRTEELRRDFSCASMVGMRGYGFERGLAAIIKSVDPELTGGPDGVVGEFPNAGFLRADARTGILIVTDENDCSHDGTLDEQDTCGSSMCEMSENMVPSPLLSVVDLKNDLMANLGASMGREGAEPEDSVIVASIHGPYQPYPLTRPSDDFFDNKSIGGKNQCIQGWDIPASCASSKGIAFSGHRYDRFIRQFAKFFPSAPENDPTAPVAGLICNEDFGSALEDIANLFRTESGGCIQDIYRCAGPDSSCPAFADSADNGTCTAYPQGNQGYYCDSGIQVRIHSSATDAAARLEATGYCEPGTIDTIDYRGGCVVARTNYRFDACPGDGKGVALEWNDPQAHNILSGMVTQMRYAKLPPAE